jgi:hypothetical protein
METKMPIEISRFISGDYARAIYENPSHYFDKDFCEKRGAFTLEDEKARRSDKAISLMGKLEKKDQIHGAGIIVDLPNFIDRAFARIRHDKPNGKINITIYEVPMQEEVAEKDPIKVWRAVPIGSLATEQIIS